MSLKYKPQQKSSRLFNLILNLSRVSSILIISLTLSGCSASHNNQRQPNVNTPAINPWQIGEEIPVSLLEGAGSLSEGQALELDQKTNLFFSNMPELPKYPGLLARSDNVVSKSGYTRIMYSHFNLLIDYIDDKAINVPGKIGVVFTNHTKRKVDILYTRMAHGVSVLPDGRRLYTKDQAPLKPGSEEPYYYGTELGNVILADFYKSNPEENEVLWQTLAPGEKAWLYDSVG